MEAVITFSEVSVVIGSVTLLDRLDLTLGPGQPTVVIGPNGSGKTTLLRAAMGLVTPDRGSISGVAKRRAIMFQHSVMLPWRTLILVITTKPVLPAWSTVPQAS